MTSRFLGAALVLAVLGGACGGPATDQAVVRIEGPSAPPTGAVRTLEPPPTPTPSPTPAPSPSPVPPPSSATMTSKAGTQNGAPSSYCWNRQIGGASECVQHPQPTQANTLHVRPGETVILGIAGHAAPDEETIRPFQGSRSGFPSKRIDPALRTELTIELPVGTWSMDLCATWHGRGQPICWLFRMDVQP